MVSNWCSFIWKYTYINFGTLQWRCLLPCCGGLHRFPWMLLIRAVCAMQVILGSIWGSLPFSFGYGLQTVETPCEHSWCFLKYKAHKCLAVPACFVCTWDGKYQWLLLSWQQRCCFCACKLLRLKICGWVLPLSIIHSVHMHYVFLLLSA